MAEKRKLMAEIEKCFKKIDEGVEEFEAIMNKMQDANSDNQRDKYQDDLKKEIKKLQRLRDQVKGWQNSSEIKDKDKLTQYRKIIEHRMEQFKDIERENKTKPHSKQGLCAEEKLDPKEKEKEEANRWLQSMITDLEVEVDRTETSIESLAQPDTSGKKGRKGKDDAKKGENQKKMEDLRKHHERMKFHINRLELCMRLVNNETLESKNVLDTMKEGLEMYVASLDPDYDGENGPSESLDPENLYEDLDLGSYATTLGGVVHVSSVDHDERHDHDNGHGHNHENGHSVIDELDAVATPGKSRHGSAEAPLSPASKKLSIPSTASQYATPQKLLSQSSCEGASSPAPSSAASATPPPPPPGIPYNSVVTAGLRPAQLQNQAPSTPPTAKTNITVQSNKPSPGSAISLVTSTSTQPTTPVPNERTNDENRSPSSATTAVVSTVTNTTTNVSAKNNEASMAVDGSAVVVGSQTAVVSQGLSEAGRAAVGQDFAFQNGPQAQEVDTLKTMSSSLEAAAPVTVSAPAPVEAPRPVIDPIGTPTRTPSTATAHANSEEAVHSQDDALRHILRVSQASNETTRNTPQAAHIPAWLGASPLGRTAHTTDHETQLLSLEQALNRCPPQMDSERPRSYLPKMPCSTAPHYPQSPPPNADTLEYYLRLSPETLFFTFYYMEGSRAQLLAAKALKKLSWRFHTKYLMWFQRHEEPKQITDDFEQGTYIYFDYEKWSQRKKESFVFEYRFLEDKDFD